MFSETIRNISILLAVVFLCVTSCGYIEIEVEETETEKVTVTPETLETEANTLFLSEAPHTESIPTVCEAILLADDTVTKIVQQTAYADTTAAIICTADFHWHFALFSES